VLHDERPIFLVGFMGSGKSAVGRRLAERLGWGFVDTDALVEREEGRSIERIFRESGEGSFREAEWHVLRGLEGARRVVVATGGGLFLGVLQRHMMKRLGRTVWLDVSLSTARARTENGEGRPLWERGDSTAMRVFFEKRRAAYAMADVRLDASRGLPDAVVIQILTKLGEHLR